MDIGEQIATKLIDAGVRTVTWLEDPGPVRCNTCGGQSNSEHIAVFDWWFRVNTCAPCRRLQGSEQDRQYRQGQKDEWHSMALAKSGLYSAELAYDEKWMDARMRGIHFAGDELTDSERGLPIWRYVWGEPGTGTTAQIALAVRYYIGSRRKRCLMMSCSAIVDGLRPEKGYTMSDFIEPELMAIDKFGDGVSTPWAGEQIAELLNERARRRKPTIFASSRPLGGEDRSIEAHAQLGGGTVAAAIFGQVGGFRGLVNMTKQHRPAMTPHRPSTRQQRQKQQTKWSGDDGCPI